MVSIHAPTRGATRCPPCTRFLNCCFNPRTHTGCDIQKRSTSSQSHLFQSTHPHGVRPTTSAFISVAALVSIHAPTRGATFVHIFGFRLDVGFNPRTHTGCDTRGNQSYHITLVSIHAPTRGATWRPIVLVFARVGFNPRTHTGCDASHRGRFGQAEGFQSTHPHGVRRLHSHSLSGHTRVSIHAPTRGATISYPNDSAQERGSIHAPTRGAT